ncbi:hypothetical protein LGV61_12780 [Desulfurispirillum indicum]|uniref:hypothetical protein n=1 Tax=Desulfurispirillum indicum TaxID=936456 RepID=UPI001CFB9679|nr:hypothetical protein [Desulfurispirillum indicum]UCZ56585.1 hypothetical protein LGV61_12780 [Desulfurispirillum indicum]
MHKYLFLFVYFEELLRGHKGFFRKNLRSSAQNSQRIYPQISQISADKGKFQQGNPWQVNTEVSHPRNGRLSALTLMSRCNGQNGSTQTGLLDIALTLFMSLFCHFLPAKSGAKAAPSAVLFSRPLAWNWGPQTTAFPGFWFAVAALVAATLRVHSVPVSASWLGQHTGEKQKQAVPP